MKSIYIPGLACLLFSACQTQQKTVSGSTDSVEVVAEATMPQQSAGGTLLLSGKWNIISIDRAAVQSAAPYIEFKNDTMVSGKTGCNSFGGEYLLTGATIKFDKIFSTRMACDAEKMTTESRVLNYLNGNLTVEKKDADGLLLKNTAGDVVIEMKRE